MGGLEYILNIGITGALEIVVLWIVFYYTFLFFRGTRGAQVLTGLVVLVLLMLLLTRLFHLDVLSWILQRLSVYLAVAFLIIFQPEIRRALAELGKQNMFAVDPPDRETIEAVIEAADMLSERKIGALIAIERQIGLRAVIETGTVIDARVSWPLLSTIFFPRTTLHDGGTVIQGNRISAAGCVFPLSPQEGLNRSLGTRHRAAIGLTEETDALVVVVSEETGTISVAFNGRLSRGLDLERLRRTLNTIVKRTRPAREGRLMRMRRMMTKTGKDAVAPTKPRNEDAGHAG